MNPSRISSALASVAIAAVCHEANRGYQLAIGEPPSPPWDDAPDWQRESALAGVEAVLDGSVQSAEAQHDAWCAHRFADGWTYGPKKDGDAKTHPCLVAYADLPEVQRAKDRLFRGIVFALAPDALNAQPDTQSDDTAAEAAVEFREPTPEERQAAATSFGRKVYEMTQATEAPADQDGAA